ncbi:MAG: hypothetical protein L3J79_07660 [Candidatus Marinimicrobia bacterium]|nr:hypothetical protein [Candidatus Neomarinimicrobiota bacterium]
MSFRCGDKSQYPLNMLGAGIAIGVAIGVAVDNIAAGIAVGVALGIALSRKPRRKKKGEHDQDLSTKNGSAPNSSGR